VPLLKTVELIEKFKKANRCKSFNKDLTTENYKSIHHSHVVQVDDANEQKSCKQSSDFKTKFKCFSEAFDLNSYRLTYELGFPYLQVNHEKKLSRSLSNNSKCYLNVENCSQYPENTIIHSKKVISAVSCASISDYVKLMVRSQVYLLADICENFIYFTKINFELFHYHANTIHSFNFDCFGNLKKIVFTTFRTKKFSLCLPKLFGEE